MEKLVHGPHTVDFDSLPESSRFAIVRRGFNHIVGNEAASKVSSHFEGESPSAEAKAAKKAEVVAEFVARLVAGTMGVRASSGPRVSPLESIMRSLAIAQIKATLAANKGTDGKPLTMPAAQGKNEGDPVPTINLGGVHYTKEELIARKLSNTAPYGRGEAIKAEAEKELRRRAREAEKAGGVESL